MTTTWKASATDTPITDVDAQHTEQWLEEALDEYWARVCRTLYNLVGDWGEAEELALEVFYRLHKRPPGETGKPGSWLYRVATHLGLNAIRARKRRRRYEEAAGELRVQQASSDDPALEIERRETQRQVRAVLATMKPRSAELLMLRYLGLSYKELAEALDVAVGSVGTLLSRAEQDFERRYLAWEERDATLG